MTVELLLAIIREKLASHYTDSDSYAEMLQDILHEYEKRKNQCKCTEFDGAFNKPYYECTCGHHYNKHIQGAIRCEGSRPADVDHEELRKGLRKIGWL